MGKGREALRLELVIFGLVAGTSLGLLSGSAVSSFLASRGAHLVYNLLPKGEWFVTIPRIFVGNLLLMLLIYFLPGRFKRHKELPGLLVGVVGFVLGFFSITSGISGAAFLSRLPHTVLEVFAYVLAARGGALVPEILAIAAAAFFEWALVLH